MEGSGIQAADESRRRIIMQRVYRITKCYYCKSDTHIYQNCPSRPCYLCKQPGHVSVMCPFPLTTQAVIAQQRKSAHELNGQIQHPYAFTRSRELGTAPAELPLVPTYETLRKARIAYTGHKVHQKRITAAEWLPDCSAILSGDKEGALRIWPISSALTPGRSLDVDQLSTEATVLMPHRCNINSFAFDSANPGTVYSASSDGMLCVSDLNNLASRVDDGADVVYDFNPHGWTGRSNWRMAYGLAFDPYRRALYVGATDGTIVRIDPRVSTSTSPCIRARFHRDKVTSLSINPVKTDILASASNDASVCLWDARKMIPGEQLGTFAHSKIVSSVTFSPNSGAKILTTSIDNRLRVWNDIHSFQGDVNAFADSQPVTIVHSHDFYRYLTPFRACWDPKDWADDLFMCGRFLGEAFYDPTNPADKGTILHPIDLFSARSGSAVLSLVDPSIPLRCTINKFCPVADVVLTAASRDVFLWVPQSHDRRKGRGRGGKRSNRGHDSNGDEDDDEDDSDGDDGRGAKRRKRRISLPSLQAKRKKGESQL